MQDLQSHIGPLLFERLSLRTAIELCASKISAFSVAPQIPAAVMKKKSIITSSNMPVNMYMSIITHKYLYVCSLNIPCL